MGFENHMKTAVQRGGIVALITLWCILSADFACGRNVASRRHDLKLPKHKGTVKTIETKRGEVIDCVDIYKQPAFDHPLLKNHTIEMQPFSSVENVAQESEKDEIMLLQEWHEEGECPEGTIPIVRTPKSVYPPKAALNISKDAGPAFGFSAPEGHEYAQVTLMGGRYFGAQASLNVWTPATEPEEFSLAQVWVTAGRDGNLNTLEAGWMADSGARFTKLFIYWTSDGYRNTGCYNHLCSGFVQVDNRFAFGSILRRISTYGGSQFNLNIVIFKNQNSGHWWLQIRNVPIGYWPDSILTTLRGGSGAISWGGEIINNNVEGYHTRTDMGSGHFPSEGFGKASYVSNIKYVDGNGNFKDPENLIPYATKPECYNVQIRRPNNIGIHFYYGGPGYSIRSCHH